MVMVIGGAMVGPQRGGRAADEDGIGDRLLELGRGFENTDQLRPRQSRRSRVYSSHLQNPSQKHFQRIGCDTLSAKRQRA
jgi:hypothetical protein